MPYYHRRVEEELDDTFHYVCAGIIVVLLVLCIVTQVTSWTYALAGLFVWLVGWMIKLFYDSDFAGKLLHVIAVLIPLIPFCVAFLTK